MKKESKDFKEKLIGFAPEFSASNKNKLGPLSCNKEELSRIATILGKGTLNIGQAANLQNFIDQASDFQIVHLATHARLDQENSAFNKIYFSDKHLSQNDISNLKLNADLVVLSACNTGTGILQKGEGVMSLSRGFTNAGCPSILMSLWSVDDCATADIMTYYYDALSQRQDKSKALQSAKVNYINQTEDRIQGHPYYWAGFVQYGNTLPLIINRSWGWVYWLGGSILLGLSGCLFFVFGAGRGGFVNLG